MAILVTGGAGYIGSHCVKRLLGDGESVAVIDNLSTGHRQACAGARLYVGDLRDRAFTRSVFDKEDIEAVIHFAAFSQVGESMRDPGKYFDNNIGAGVAVLDAMALHGVKYIVFSSTAAVYGEPERVPITEDDAKLPTNPYGESKLAMEKIMGWYQRAYGIRYCPLRYFNVAGAWPDASIGEAHDPETHLIPIVLQAALKKRKGITVFGTDYPTPDGTCIRDYVHVTDLIDGHVRALARLRDGGESEAFNLGIGRGFSVMEIIEAARVVTGRDIPVSIGERREGDPAVLIASGEKAMSVLDWRPKHTDVKTVIADAWRWHSTRGSWDD